MKPSEIHEWILKVAAPAVGVLLLVLHGLGDSAGEGSEGFYILIAALIGARLVLPDREDR